MGSVRAKQPAPDVRSSRPVARKAAKSCPRKLTDLPREICENDGAEPPLPVSVIRNRADFLAMRDGARANTPGFLLLSKKNPENGRGVRYGLTVTRKIGNAVCRNRIKRRFREVVRTVLPKYGAPGVDYVLIARGAAYNRNFDALLDDLKRALLRRSRNSI